MSKNTTPPMSANTITKQLRWYLKNCGTSNLQLGQKLGIHNSTFSRFLRSKRGMGLDTLDVVCKHLNLRLVRRRRH